MNYFVDKINNDRTQPALRGVKTSAWLLAGTASLLALTTTTRAATQLHFDINTVEINASPAITGTTAATYTGTITIGMNTSPSSYLEGIDIDNFVQPISGTLTAVSGVLHMTDGAISTTPASTLSFTVENSDSTFHSYTGTYDEMDSNSVFIEGDVNPTYLDSSNFAGVNVSQWADRPVDGAVIMSNFSGDTANLDVYALPEPGIGWLAATVVGSLGIRRRKI